MRSDSPPTPGPFLAATREVYTVSRLNAEVRALLENGLPPLWLEGEVSNLSRPASGHLYLSLKDDQAQVRCAMFRSRNITLAFAPANGMHVLVRARAGLYEPRGEFQLVLEHMEPAGEGALRLAFEALKRKLATEGLFAAQRKRPLPAFPRCLGVITSPTGAALRDVLSVLRRRFPALPVVVYPVPVQGGGAANRIAAMIDRASQRADCDVLLVTRGGGSLEDLWAFNEEVVARAIARCAVPVVSGVGHEIDFTIADFVADVRAPTPSAAAELISPDRTELGAVCRTLEQRLIRAWAAAAMRCGERLRHVSRRLLHPGRRIEQFAQRLDELSARHARALRARLRERGAALGGLRLRLRQASPGRATERLRTRLNQDARELLRGMHARRQTLVARVEAMGRTLHAVSPPATLARGYAIVTRRGTGTIVRDATTVTPGELISARLARGTLDARIERSRDDTDEAAPGHERR
ncbi:MAG: exodeoxyribonuclease VII large subunit [Gammaproteobacteria bacterium]|nr:exodeoxyribonuclease VII large subunit [Gammaproteobacteria bacterium]